MATSPLRLSYSAPISSLPTQQEMDAQELDRARNERATGWGPLNPIIQGYQGFAAGERAGDFNQQALDAEVEFGKDSPAFSSLRRRADMEAQKSAIQRNRVGSVSDVQGVGDALNYLGGGLGQVAGSMGPVIAGAAAGSLMGGPAGALVGGLRGAVIRGAAPIIGGTIAGYDMNRGETVSGQYADPQAMERSAAERQGMASMTALGKSALDAIPAAYGLRALSGAGKVARAERVMSRPMQTLTGAAAESGTEMLQTEADYQGLQALGSTKERNLAEYADAGILGAVGGGVFSGATNLVGAGMDKGADAAQAVKDNKYVQEGTELATKGAKAAYEVSKTALGLSFDAATGAVKGIDRAAQHLGVKDWTAKGIKDSTTRLVEQLKNSPLVEPVIDAANKAVDATQGILGPEHFDNAATSLGAAMQAKSWSELVRNSFGNPFSDFLARAGLTDIQDPAVIDGSKTPEAAAAERDGILESGRRQAAHTILNSPAFSPSDKQKVLSMGVNGDYSKLDAEQTVWLANRVASRYFAPKLDEIYNGGRDLLQQLADHVFGALNKTDAAADPTKRNSQVGTRSDFSELITAARVRPLTAALASLSTDRAGNAPAHARQLLQINDALQQVGYLTLEQRSFVTNLSTRLMEYDKKDAVVKALQEAGANDLLNALTQEREAPGALADLRSETSWLRSLTPEVAALPRSTLESIAGFVDEYAIKYISPGLNEHQRDAILAMAIRAFGSEEVAHNALTEFGQQRMEGLEAAWQEQAAQADAAAEQEAADYRAANPAQVAEAERVLAMNGYEGARLQEAIDRHLKKKFGKKLDEVTADDIADAMVAVAADVEAEYEGATGEFDASSTYGAEYGALTEQGPSGLEASFKLRNPNRPFRNDDRALSNEAMAKRTAADPSARVMPLLDYLEGAGIDPALYVRKMAKDFQSLLRNGEGHRAAYEQFKKETGYTEEADDQKEALSVDVGTPIPEEEGGGTRVTSPFRQKLEALQLAVKRAGLNLIRPEILGGLSAEWATIARKDKATPASKPHTGPEFPHILRDLADFDVSANTGQRILRGNYDVDRAALLKDFIARFAPGGDLEARIKRNEARIEAGKAPMTAVADAMIAALSEAKIEKTDPKMEYAFGIRNLGRALDALEAHMDSEPNPYRGLKNYSVIASERNDTVASDAQLEKFKNTIANKTRATDEEIQAVKIHFKVVGGMTKMTLAADSMMAASPEKGGSMLTRFLGALGAVLNRPDVVGLDMTDKQLNDMVVSRKLGITFGELVKREQKRFSKAGDVKKLREQLAKRAKATAEQKDAHKAKYAAGVNVAEAEWRKSRGAAESVARDARGIWQRFVNSSLEKLGPAAFARRGERGLRRSPAYHTYRNDQPLNEREPAAQPLVDPIQLLRDDIARRKEGPLTSALRDILAGMEAIRLKGTPTEEFLDSMQRIKDGLASLDGSEAIGKLREEIAGAAKDSKKLVRLNAQLKTLTENNGELAKLSTLASRIRSLKSKAKKKGEPVEDFNTDLALIDNRVRNIVNAAYPTKKRDTSTDLDEDNEVRGLQATEQTNAIVNAYLNSAVLEERADIYDALRMFTDADRARAAAAAFESDVAKFEDEERRFVDETTGEYLDARITNESRDVEPAGGLNDKGEFVKGTPTSVTQDRPSRRVLARMALNAAQATVAKLTKLKTLEPAQITQLRVARADVAGLTDYLNRAEAWEKRKPETIEGGESPQFGDLNARLDAAQGAWAQLNNEIKLMEQYDQVKAERKTALDAYKAVYNDKTASQEALDEAKEAFEALDAEFKTLKEPDAQELEALKAQRKSAAREWRMLDRVVFNDPVKKAEKAPSDKTEAEEVADAIKRLQNRIDTGRAGTPYVYKPRMDELLTRAEQLATPVVEDEAAPKVEAAPTVPRAIAETILRAPEFAHKKETAKALGAKQIMAPLGVKDAWSSTLAATAKRLGMLLNKGKNAASGAIIYASVPGNGRDWSKAARDAFIEELKDAMDAGAYIRLDTAKMAFSKHNIEGEGVVHKALHDAGYAFKEVKGLYGVWSYPDTQQETQTEASGNSFEIVKQDFGKKIDGVIDGHRAGTRENPLNVTNARPGGPGALGNPFIANDVKGGKYPRDVAVAKFKEAFLDRVNSDPAYKAWVLTLRGKKIGYYAPDEEFIHLHEVQKWLAKQPAAQGSAPTDASTKPMNVYYGSGENKSLSNFALRPFEWKDDKYYSVEHAYQTLKSGTFDDATYGKYTGKDGQHAKGTLGTKTDDNWNLRIIKSLMRASFKQNPKALEALLATGDRQITHKAPNLSLGVWEEAFPRILMELREELGSDPTQRSSFVGKKGDAAGAYKAARKITAKDGFDPKELFEKTGWFLGPDGKLRKELDPTPIVNHIKALVAVGKTATTVRDVLKATYPKLLEAYDRAAKKDKAARSFGDITIDLNAPPTKGRPLHAGAFNAKDWRIKVIPHAAYAQFTLGSTAASRTDDQRAAMTIELMQQSGAIDLTSAASIVATATPEQLHAGVSAAYPEVAALTLEDMTQQAVAYVFIHELQHAIQEVEGFSRGGNRESGLISKYGDPGLIKEAQAEYQRNEYDGPAYKAALKQATEAAAKSGDVAAAANAAYGSITGEQEANDVQNRLNLTPAQRGEALPVLMSPKNEFLMSVFRETPVPDITPDQIQKKTTPAERRAAKDAEAMLGHHTQAQPASKGYAIQNAQLVVDAIRKANPKLLTQVEDLHAQDLTAGEIATKLGIEVDLVRDLRIGLGLPSQGKAAGSIAMQVPGDAEERRIFEAWRDARRQATPAPAPTPAQAPKVAPAAPQAAPAAPQAPAPKARKRPKRVNPTAVHPVAAEIQKIVYTSLGKGPRLKLDQTVAQMGRQGYFSGQAGELIAIAIDTADPLGNTHHEVMHAFFARLGFDKKSRELKNTLTSAVSLPHVLAKLEDFVSGMPDALAAIKQGAPHYLEERLALAYQIYTTGGPAALGLTPAVRNIFGKIAAYFRSVLNLLNEAEVTEKVMLMLHSGELASPNTIHEKLATLRIETSQQTFDRYVPYVGDAVRSVFKAGSDVLRDSGVQVLVDVADKFEGINGELGFIDRRARVENIFTSRLAKLLDKHTEEEIREATESAQAMRQLKPGLETEVAKLLNDVFAYMDKKGVKTSRWVEGTDDDPGYVEWIPIQKINKGRYFPRQWDGEYITTHEKEWNELLTKNGVSPSDAAKLTEAIIKGDGRLELKEGEHHLGFTPYVKALQHRGLHFINEKNAAAFAKFQSKDTVDILTTYIRQAAHRGEYAELFGNNGEVIEAAIAHSKLSVDEKVKMRRTISGLEGTLGWDMPQSTKELFSAGLTIQNVLLLPLAIYSQMIDPLMIAARSGDVMDAGRAYLEALKQLKNKITGERTEAQDLADMMGMLSEESVIAAMGNTHGSMYMSGGFRKFNEMFFRYNGLQGWNQSMRSAATLAGVRYLVKHKDNATELAEIGLKPSDVVVGPNNSLVVKGNKKVQEALFRFVDESVVRPNALHRPTWMSDPRFMLIAHLKQFTFSQHKVILGRVVDQAEKGNYQPAAMLALAAPVMLAADMAKWMMTGTVPDSWTWGDYASHAVQRAGILGKGQFAADALNDAARGGTPGTSFLGPTFEHLATLFQGLTGSASGTEVLERSIPAGRYIL